MTTRSIRQPWLLVALLLCVLGWPGLAAAQNPCIDIPLTQLAISPTSVAATLTQQTALDLDGTPIVAAYDLGVFLPGVSTTTGAPISTVTVPKASFAPVSTAPGCYLLSTLPAELLGVPKGTAFVAAMRTRQTNGVLSIWTVSNPFGFPAALLPPGAVRVQK